MSVSGGVVQMSWFHVDAWILKCCSDVQKGNIMYSRDHIVKVCWVFYKVNVIFSAAIWSYPGLEIIGKDYECFM